ncbi:hypothetical protein Hdeb2414_s0002g00059061 [Helianthus debilis subsp. tardiflorus]
MKIRRRRTSPYGDVTTEPGDETEREREKPAVRSIIRRSVQLSGRFVIPVGTFIHWSAGSGSVQVSGTGSRVRVTAVVQVPGGHRQDAAVMMDFRQVT